MTSARIGAQGSYNPDGTPGTITTGVPGPGPTDDQVSAAVSVYLAAHPPIQQVTPFLAGGVTLIGPGAAGANDVALQVSNQASKDLWLQTVNGFDPLNATGRTPSNLVLAAETGGTVKINSTLQVSTVTAVDTITLATPRVLLSPTSGVSGRVPVFWGTVTADPTTGVQNGDMAYRSDLAATRILQNGTWKSITVT